MTPFSRRRKADSFIRSPTSKLQHNLESQNDYVRSQRSIGGRRSNCMRLKQSATNMGCCYRQLLPATVSLGLLIYYRLLTHHSSQIERREDFFANGLTGCRGSKLFVVSLVW